MLKRFAVALAIAMLAGICSAAYPDRPIRLVVPVAPGGAVDVVGRLIGQKLSSVLGQNVVIDNRAGANYIINYIPGIAYDTDLMHRYNEEIIPLIKG